MITRNFLCPISGKLKSIEEVDDVVFSDRIMGDGFAIQIDGKDIVSPIDGKVAGVFPTGHAVCIEGENGLQVLIHIGLETHHIKKKVFEMHVEKGQDVKAGQLLVTADYKLIRKSAKSDLCPIVFLNKETITVLKLNQSVHSGENGIIEIEYN